MTDPIRPIGTTPPAATDAAREAAPPSPVAPKATDPAWKAAQEFEAMMLAQMFEHMFAGVGRDSLFGGGEAEKTWRSFLFQSYAEGVAESGGLGIARHVHQEIARLYRQSGDES